MMRILIVSDTHRNHSNLKRVLSAEAPIDMLIHLGDAEGCEREIAYMADCPLEIVSGNSDVFSFLEREKELMLGRYRTLITHGHYYYVNMGLAHIKQEAEARGFDIVMFGHTHRPMIDFGKNLITLNPGSLSYPRQEGRRPSYIMMELEGDLPARFRLEYL